MYCKATTLRIRQICYSLIISIPFLITAACQQKVAEQGSELQSQRGQTGAEPQGLIERKIIVNGKGKTENDAINDALVVAVKKIQGVDIESEELQQLINEKNTVAERKRDGVHDIKGQRVYTSTSGHIKDFVILDSHQTGFIFFKEHTVRLEVTLPTEYRPDADLKKIKIALLPLRAQNSTGVSMAKDWSRELETNLVQSGRFAILDRSFTEVIKSETDQYVAGGDYSVQELARRGQRAGADFVITGEVLQGRTGDTVSLRVIEVASGQVKYAGNFQGPVTRVAGDIIDHFFPLVIVGMNGSSVLLSRGGESMKTGQQFDVFLSASSMKDPYSGEKIDGLETNIGRIEIIASGEKSSTATIVTGADAIASKISQHLIVRKISALPENDHPAGAVSTKSKADRLKKKEGSRLQTVW